MKKYLKRALSLMLSFVIVATGIQITPLNTKAAIAGGGITSSKDTTGVGSYYWQGEEFSLSLASNGTVKADSVSVTKDGADAKAQFESIAVEEDGTTTADDALYKNYKINVKVKADAAAGTYTFKVSDGSSESSKTIDIFAEDMIQINPTFSNDGNSFYNKKGYTFTETFLYSKVAYDKLTDAEKANALTFDLNEEVDEILDITVSQPDTLTYKGCVAYTVTFKVKETGEADDAGNPVISLEEDSQRAAALTISYKDKDSQVQTETVNYTVLQACTGLADFELVACSNATNYSASGSDTDADYLKTYPHVNSTTDTVYVDATETVYFKTELKGTNKDGIRTNIADFQSYFDFGNSDADAYGFTKKTAAGMTADGQIIVKMTALKNATKQAAPLALRFTTSSGKTLEYKVHVYNTYYDEKSYKQEIQIKDGNTTKTINNETGIQLMYDPNISGGTPFEMKALRIDEKENVIWRVSDTSTASFSGGTPYDSTQTNNNLIFQQTQTPVLTGKKAGQTGIDIRTEKTLTRPEGIFSVESSISFVELVLPEEGNLKIVYNEEEKQGDTLKVGDSRTYALKGAGNYTGYKWVSSNESIATVKDGLVTAKAQGEVTIYATTNFAADYPVKNNIKSNEMKLTVYGPISTLELKDEDGEVWGSTKEVIANREYTIVANKGDSNEAVRWNIPDTTAAKIKKPNGSLATADEWVEGDTCTFVVENVTEQAQVIISCAPVITTGVNAQSTLIVKPELSAEKVYIDSEEDTISGELNKTIELGAIQYNNEAERIRSNEELEWSTDDTDVVEITPSVDGSRASIRLIGTGEATITLKAKKSGVTDQVKIKVIKYATGISYAYTNTNRIFAVGEAATFTAKMNPVDATETVEWIVEPAGILDMEEVSNGVVKFTAKAGTVPGTQVRISAKTSDSGRTSSPMTFTIIESINSCTITLDKTSYPYTGLAIIPVEKITCGQTELVKGTDYNVSYRDNVNAGTATMIITGRGNYSGTKEITFQITPASLQNAEFTPIANMTYTGSELKPNVTVKVNGKQLYVSREFEVSYANNINAGTATVTVKGIGNYSGTASTTFVISPKDMRSVGATLEYTATEYTGAPLTPAVTVKDSSKELTAGVDYIVEYVDNVEVSTTTKPTVKVTGIGNYTGTKELNFQIRAKALTEDMVKLSKTDYVYNGKQRKPKVTVTNPATGKKLKVNKDYTVTYPTDMVNKGVKKIMIQGKGSYTGTIYVEYGIAEKISLKKPTISSVKNNKKKQATIKIKKVNNAEGYEITYSTDKKFKKDVKVTTSKKLSKTIKKLKKGKTYYFKVRAYATNSIGRKVYSSASKVKKVKIKK